MSVPDRISPNLTQTRDVWRQAGAGAWLFYDFVLAQGRYYPGQCLPRRYRRRQPKACFFNARSLVLGSKRLRYCEGFAMSLRLGIPFEHAWALSPDDEVIEPTLTDANLYQFFGLPFDRAWLRREWRWTGILRDDIGVYRDEVMRVLAPDWVREVYEPAVKAHRQQACFE